MKNAILTLLLIASFIQKSNSQIQKGIYGNSNWMTNWTNFKPSTTEYKDSNIILTGVISENTTLTKSNVYLLVGVVYVTNKAFLTIEPGTVIRGDYESCGTLVVTNGAKIIAKGNDTDPIVFTSNKGASERKAGDWGGIILFGDAPINKYGGIAQLDFNLDNKFVLMGERMNIVIREF
jgi:hypothetical protein